MKAYRAAVIGCGTISRRHLEALHNSERAQLAAVCDVREERARAASEKWGVPYVADYHALLRDPTIDSVHLCLPHYLHAPVAIETLRAGKHVFTEKPMAITSSDCERMCRTAEECGKALGVSFQNRYKPTNARAKDLISSGEVGRVLGARAIVTWYRTPTYYTDTDWRGKWATEGGGVLINQSIHTLDLLLWMLGEPDNVQATCACLSLSDTIEVEDTAAVRLSFPAGAVAVFFATNGYSDNAPVELELRCEKALLTLNEDSLTVRRADGQVEVFRDETPRASDKDYWGNCHRLIIDDFYASVAEGRPFAVDGAEAARAIRLIERIYKAAQFGPRA